MKATVLLIVLGIVLVLLPSARAGQGILLPNVVSGVTYAISFSYPDTLKHGENYTVSMNMAVLFNNASITNVNVMQIDVFVVPENVNPSSAFHEMTKYFVGEQQASDYSHPLYTIRRELLGETVVANFDEILLTEGNSINEGRIGKFYVEIQFEVETNTAYYPLIYYADVGEMPGVQLLPSELVQVGSPLYQNAGLIVAGILGIGGCLVFLVAIRRRKSEVGSIFGK
jgi:hypothetical protein